MHFRSICQLTSLVTALAGCLFIAAPALVGPLMPPGGWLDAHTLLTRNIGLILLVLAFLLFLMRAVRSAVWQQSLAAGCSIVLVVAGAMLAWAILTGQAVTVAVPELIETAGISQVADSSDTAATAKQDAAALKARQSAIGSVQGLFWAVVALLCFNGITWGVSVMPGESRRHRNWR